MKLLITNKPLNHIKSSNVLVLVLLLCVVLPHFVYGWEKTWNPESGMISIVTTGEENITITKHPDTGGLAVNGVCTGVLASDVKELNIFGDELNNQIDLRGMNKNDFPYLVREGIDKEQLFKIEVFAGAGNDIVWGSDLGNCIWGGKGDDTLEGGSRPDALSGDEGTDTIVGDKDDFRLKGGEGMDWVKVGGKVTIGKRTSICTTDLISNNSLLQSSYLLISDSSGIDSLSFAEFDSSIVLDLDLFNTPQIYTANNDTLLLYGIFEYFIGTQYDDVIYVDPDSDVPRYVDGGGSDGADTLYLDAMGKEVSDGGHTITIQGYQPIIYENFDCCVITNAAPSGLGGKDICGPNEFRLFQNYPNPFNPITHIRYVLTKSAIVKLSIYN
ncbi:hypothetical protein HQ585_00755, partial [candidate division KSB1 bacterium]|nr:hypothetical protein [candidate division KSB1 bacterium]